MQFTHNGSLLHMGDVEKKSLLSNSIQMPNAKKRGSIYASLCSQHSSSVELDSFRTQMSVDPVLGYIASPMHQTESLST